MNESVYIATLGFAPQVVTLALSEIQGRFPDHKIEKVVVIHTDSSIPENAESLKTLQDAFKQNEFLSKYTLEPVEIRLKGKPVADLRTVEELDAAFQTFFQTILDAKSKGKIVHLNVAGGRKPMAIFAIVAAQLLFDDRDYAWYLISDQDFMDKKKLLPDEQSKVQLVQIPVVPWNFVDPVLAAPDFSKVSLLSDEMYKELYRRRRDNALRLFVMRELTPQERRVLREVLTKGGSLKDLARRLKKSPRTVEHQIQSIYKKFKERFGIPADKKLRRDTLMIELGPIIGIKAAAEPEERSVKLEEAEKPAKRKKAVRQKKTSKRTKAAKRTKSSAKRKRTSKRKSSKRK